jgi:hypothetical protein
MQQPLIDDSSQQLGLLARKHVIRAVAYQPGNLVAHDQHMM